MSEVKKIVVFYGQAFCGNETIRTWLAGSNRFTYECQPVSNWMSQKDAIEVAKGMAKESASVIEVYNQGGNIQQVITDFDRK